MMINLSFPLVASGSSRPFLGNIYMFLKKRSRCFSKKIRMFFQKDLDLFLITSLSFSNWAEMSLEFGPWAHSNACTLNPISRRLAITTSTLVELKCRVNASYMYCGPALNDQ